MAKILLCSDLDRTILPNGSEPESPEARPLLRRLAEQDGLALVYVSGRSESLLKKAIDEYDLPLPDWAIGDVGTTIYNPRKQWQAWDDWAEEIGKDWQGRSRAELQEVLADIPELRPQEAEKQNTFKLSFYSRPDIDHRALSREITARLSACRIRAEIIWSIDEQAHVGLIDILPQRASKLHAIRFLMVTKGFAEEKTVFAGDSGNDLAVLVSGLNAVLVRNAHRDVRQQAEDKLARQGLTGRLYSARGDFLGMNGNYAAGVLEGLAHFLPETRAWMSPV